MKGLLTVDVITFVLVLIFTSGADTGYYCTGKKQHWINANKACLDNGGKPLNNMTGLNNVLDALLVNQSMERDMWTADYLKYGSDGSYTDQVCGFHYKSGTSNHGTVIYGDCDKNRSYICRDKNTDNVTIHKGNYYYALKTCAVVGDLGNFNFTPGYYWVKGLLNVEKLLYVQHVYERTELKKNRFKCGAYSMDIGLYFGSCSDKLLSFCHFESIGYPNSETYKSCSEEWEASTLRSLPNTIVTAAVSVVSEKANKSTTTAASTDTVSHNSTEDNHQGDVNHVVTESTSNQIDTKRPKEDSLVKDEEKDSNVGIEVGLPVGLCLALICGIILSIYLARRHRCWKKTEADTNNSKAKCSDNKSSKGLVRAHHNITYNASEDKHIRIIVHGETDKESQQYTEPNAEYAVVHKRKQHHENTKRTEQLAINGNKIGQSKTSQKLGEDSYSCPYGNEDNFAKSNVSQTAEYSFAKETGQYSSTEEDYDTTANVQRCMPNTSNNIYNKVQSDEYDSTATVRVENDHVYDKTQGAESEYDTTKEGNESSPCDDVYNHLSQDDNRNDQNDYDSTFNISKLGPVKFTDHTYGKLKEMNKPY